MFRKFILSAALATAAITGVAALPAIANAQPVRYDRHDHYGRFEVLVRQHGCWENYGTFHDRTDARSAARRLRHRGFEVKIEWAR